MEKMYKIMDELIQQAKNLIQEHYQKGKHTVGAALRTKSGMVFTGISINGQRLDLCAEWTAIGNAMMEKDDVVMSVAVHQKQDGTFEIYPPCALCRELFVTYFPEAQIIVSEGKSVKALDLLPNAWKRN